MDRRSVRHLAAQVDRLGALLDSPELPRDPTETVG